MSVSDPIADMLTRIRNAILAGHQMVSVPSSKIKLEIARILKQEGYIEDFEEAELESKVNRVIRIRLKYVGERRERQAVISGIERVSRPGRRIYVGKREIPWIKAGMGIAILTTPKGVMTGDRARQLGVGGEFICQIW
jgi:small subunit ribosomal protein S8